MPELKHFDPDQVVQSIHRAADDAQSALQRAFQEALDTIDDVKTGLQVLDKGMGPILERAEHVFVATFDFNVCPDAEGMAICDPVLQFQSTHYQVPLAANYYGSPMGMRPRMRTAQRYRVIVTLEPVE